MGALTDLDKSISSMTDEEILQRILEIRTERISAAPEPAKKDGEKKKKTKKRKKKTIDPTQIDLGEAVENMSPAQLAQLKRRLNS